MADSEYAVVDGEGRYGDEATVYHVGDRASCEGVAAAGRGVQVVQYAGLDVGDTLVRVAVVQGAGRYVAAVTEAKERAAARRDRDAWAARAESKMRARR